jgi:NADPH2:quinone reductase
MRAAYYEKNGPAAEVLQLAEVDMPEPGPGEVRVKLKTSGVNPSDVKARAGSRKAMSPYVIPHSDGAGEIDAVGTGVARRIGDRVWTWNGQWKRPFGTCAEYVVLPEAQAVSLPAHVSFEAGACLGIPALTAWRAVEVAEAGHGTTLLITGGAGAVAHYAIQFAKARGAQVITTVSSAEKARLARQAGADHTIDYKRENVGERVMALTGNRGANAALIPGVLRSRGIVVVYGVGGPDATVPASFCLQNAITLKFIFVYELTEQERGRAIAGITAMLEGNRLINNVAQTFALDDVVAAHQAVEQGRAMGNVVVKVG